MKSTRGSRYNPWHVLKLQVSTYNLNARVVIKLLSFSIYNRKLCTYCVCVIGIQWLLMWRSHFRYIFLHHGCAFACVSVTVQAQCHRFKVMQSDFGCDDPSSWYQSGVGHSFFVCGGILLLKQSGTSVDQWLNYLSLCSGCN